MPTKKLGQNSEALSSLNTAISVRPLYATAYRQIGDVYQNMKNYPEAIAAYKKCVEIDKSNEAAYYNLGYISNATGEYTNALYWLHKALSLQQKVTTYNEIGFAYYKQKMNDSAIAAYRNALRITPLNEFIKMLQIDIPDGPSSGHTRAKKRRAAPAAPAAPAPIM